MKRQKSGLIVAVWLLAVMLFVSVAATTIAYFDIMKTYMPDDEGAISLVQLSPGGAENGSTVTPPENVSSDSEVGNVSGGNDDADVKLPDGFVKNPSFSVNDKHKTWTTVTKVEIFRASYENDSGEVTVQSVDGSKVIAPGTSNSYVFKLKNTGNVALDYDVELNVDIKPNDGSIPLTARISRHDGKWIAGGHEFFIPAEQLADTEDNATLSAGNYTYYTLEWCWPFEGDDVHDTTLGNLVINAETEVSFTLEIVTTATESKDPFAEGGIVPPPTGDDTRLSLWVTVAVSSLVLIIIILIIDKKQKKRDTAQEAKAFETA